MEYRVVRHRPMSSDIRHQLGAACPQSRGGWSNATRAGETDGGREMQSRQALSMAFVVSQVVGLRRLYRRCYRCL